jgi:hypothetical protein
MAKLQLDANVHRNNLNDHGRGNGNSSVRARVPKLPEFNENIDKMVTW